ncbi:MAG: L,D-transpeptidase family protein [Calditrichota bacterium]
MFGRISPSLIAAFLICCLTLLFAQEFKREQLRYPRVRGAYHTSEETVKQYFVDAKANYPPAELFIRIFKQQNLLEVWAADTDTSTFTMIKGYSICYFSGEIGPKRKQGDLQLPEGFYMIDRFNPVSRYHLSLGINYPNASDRKLTNAANPGGDIFIHGNCVSIGCAAMKDSVISEIYVMAVEAGNYVKPINVHIFPTRMSGEKYEKLKNDFPEHREFWKSIEKGYLFFENERKVPEICITSDGWYGDCLD